MINLETIPSYCSDLTQYNRRQTREVKVGNLGIGGDNPIRIQSMTTTDTMDTMGTVEQSIRMIHAGCELVRITAPGIRAAENLQNIKDELRARGYETPLVADIHYTPNAAITAARIVEKIRINPGNYSEQRSKKKIGSAKVDYQDELIRIKDKFAELVSVCQTNMTAMRIGVNHGSLSERILIRFGDTPRGMVESAMEYLRFCQDLNYHQIIISMKSSNPQVMIHAYRLLVVAMDRENMNYPLHLGVTEAGEGEDGRIKSALGIGTLLEDGLGDTIRVSLTEEPENELPVAKQLIQPYQSGLLQTQVPPVSEDLWNPFDHQRRKSYPISIIGGDHKPVVLAEFIPGELTEDKYLNQIGYYRKSDIKWLTSDTAADLLYIGKHSWNGQKPSRLGFICDVAVWDENKECFPLFDPAEYGLDLPRSPILNFVALELSDLIEPMIRQLRNDNKTVIIMRSSGVSSMVEFRRFFMELDKLHLRCPVILERKYDLPYSDQITLKAAVDTGGVMIDGWGEGIWIRSNVDSRQNINLSFNILQACRLRMTKTDYISCPSCGRTLFNLQETTAKIRARTQHLKGVKIGIMGCIVNGPGEMADADYGYVGTGKGKVSLYNGHTVYKNNIPEDEAVDELIRLIKSKGDWVQPNNENI